MNTPTDPLEAEIADLLNQVAYRGYVAGQRKDTGDAENLYIQSEIVVQRATDRILALIHTREQQARVDQMRQDMKFMNSQIGLNVDVDKFVDEQLATFNKEETNEQD